MQEDLLALSKLFQERFWASFVLAEFSATRGLRAARSGISPHCCAAPLPKREGPNRSSIHRRERCLIRV